MKRERPPQQGARRSRPANDTPAPDGFPHPTAEDLRLLADVGASGALVCQLGLRGDGQRLWEWDCEQVIWLARCGLVSVRLCLGGSQTKIDGLRTRLVSACLEAFDDEDVLLELTQRGRAVLELAERGRAA